MITCDTNAKIRTYQSYRCAVGHLENIDKLIAAGKESDYTAQRANFAAAIQEYETRKADFLRVKGATPVFATFPMAVR